MFKRRAVGLSEGKEVSLEDNRENKDVRIVKTTRRDILKALPFILAAGVSPQVPLTFLTPEKKQELIKDCLEIVQSYVFSANAQEFLDKVPVFVAHSMLSKLAKSRGLYARYPKFMDFILINPDFDVDYYKSGHATFEEIVIHESLHALSAAKQFDVGQIAEKYSNNSLVISAKKTVEDDPLYAIRKNNNEEYIVRALSSAVLLMDHNDLLLTIKDLLHPNAFDKSVAEKHFDNMYEVLEKRLEL